MTTQSPSKPAKPLEAEQVARSNALWNMLRQIPSQILLALGGVLMIFPVVWMVSASLKPEWQIFVRPIIWLPQDWHKTDAGSSARLLNLYTIPNDAGVRIETIELGARVFTTVVDVAALGRLRSVEAELLGSPRSERIGRATLSVRELSGERLVAVGRDGANLLVVPLEDVREAFNAPLEEINAATSTGVAVNSLSVQAVTFKTAGGEQKVVNLGPQNERALMAEKTIASTAQLVPAESLGISESLPLPNNTNGIRLEQFKVPGLEGPQLLLERALWRPVLDVTALRKNAKTVNASQLKFDSVKGDFNGAKLETAILENGDRIAVLLRDADQMLTVPLEVANQIVLVPSASLQRPVLETVAGLSVRVKDFTLPTVRDETINFSRLPNAVGIIGEAQEKALVIPANRLRGVLDVPKDDVQKRSSLDLKWRNYSDAMARDFAGATFLTFFKNSLVITILSIIGHLISCTLVAYAFARFRAPGKNTLFVLVLATMMLPEFATLVPVYKIFRDLGMVDTLTPMFIRSFFGNAFLIFLLRQFFSTIPRDLEEAAFLDGATRFQIFVKVMLPLVTPALMTVTIFTFLWRWNDLLNAAIYLNSPENYTVSLGLRTFMGQYVGEFNLLMAATTVASIPTVLLFFFAQRFFIEGITLTGSKG
jgi:multiple sugar transport system permease protein